MARYRYIWQRTEHGRRLVREPITRPEPAPADPYDGLLKQDIVELADSRGIDSSGTKAEIVERLRADDE